MEYVKAKTIVTKTKDNSWFGIDYNMNIYRGCCHGCIYCDSRSSCYHVDDFDTVKAKEDALRLIRDDLRRKVKTGVVGTGAMSDPYNPFEKELLLTRHALELIDAFGFGAAIATKSDLLTRDIDILKSIKEHSPVLCKVTITTVNRELAGKIEPHVSSPDERFAMIEKLSSAGIFTGILLMPVLPFIEDQEENLLSIVKKAHETGAKFIYPGLGVTLRYNQREWYYEKLNQLFPGKGLVEQYQKQYGNRYKCSIPGAARVWKLLNRECENRGILFQMKDIMYAYKRGYQMEQYSLFDMN